MTPLLNLFLCKRLSNLGYIVQSYMRNPWKNNQTNNITTSSWQTVMWPCLDKHKGHVLKFCWISRVNLIKNLSQLLYTLARSLVQHHQLTPTAGSAMAEGLRRSVVIIWLKMRFLQPSLPGHGALQDMAVTFAMTSLKCSEHRLSPMASLDKGRGSVLQIDFESWFQSHLAQDRTPLYTAAASGPHVNWHFSSLVLIEPYFQQLLFFFLV